MQYLVTLSKRNRKTKDKFIDYSDSIKNTFNLSDEEIREGVSLHFTFLNPILN
jgi:hypothetical protein